MQHQVLSGNWQFPTSIHFGAGRLSELADELALLGVIRPLVVTDRGLTRTGLPDRVVRLAGRLGAAVALHAEVGENPSDRDVAAGVEAFRAHRADSVIALGGGSGLDCGKAIALMAGCGGPIERFVWPRMEAASERSAVPIIALPTTAGTGAEVEASSMITLTADRVKAAVVSHSLMPKLVIADPDLTLSLPPHLTAATGMDALSHNLEALLVPSFHPMADAIAIRGVQLCLEWLPKAVEDGANPQARASMMVAAIMGATAFGKGLGAMHALSHAIGGLYSTQHGVTNAVLMPHVLHFNRYTIETKVADLAAACGINRGFDSFLERILDISARIGIPENLAALGVPRQGFADIAERAEHDVCAATNPRPINREGLMSILDAAYL